MIAPQRVPTLEIWVKANISKQAPKQKLHSLLLATQTEHTKSQVPSATHCRPFPV